MLISVWTLNSDNVSFKREQNVLLSWQHNSQDGCLTMRKIVLSYNFLGMALYFIRLILVTAWWHVCVFHLYVYLYWYMVNEIKPCYYANNYECSIITLLLSLVICTSFYSTNVLFEKWFNWIGKLCLKSLPLFIDYVWDQ